jgi:hydroxylamine reductase
MFCEQCEQTSSGQGCHQWGACGKSPEVNAVQDVLIYCVRSLATVALMARDCAIATRAADRFVCEAIFATMTNVNFDDQVLIDYVRQAIALREDLKTALQTVPNPPQVWPHIADYFPNFEESLANQGRDLSLKFINESGQDIDIFSLKQTILYGLKGVASYAFHASELGQEDDQIYNFIDRCLADLDRTDICLEAWVQRTLKVGEINYQTLELLDAGHTQRYGHPQPTVVPLNVKAGKALLVSGHDLVPLEAVLRQTAHTGITVYTHGELLPAHAYPKLKQTYPHLYGHYGTAWQNQTREFAKFPGAIVITTNCLMPPHEVYEHKLFSVDPVGYPGLRRVPQGADGQPDFAAAIATTLALPGFTISTPPRQVITGFAHQTMLRLADQLAAAVKAGKIRHFFLVGGCDGAKPDRNYYTEFVEKVPKDCVVLTLACGKFRFFDRDLGQLSLGQSETLDQPENLDQPEPLGQSETLPRLLDVGQCNDVYSAIQIAIILSQSFGVDVSQLPLSMILSWYEQKSVAMLLTLLYLGMRNIRLGPTLPAFFSPRVFQLLAETYALQPITTPEADLAKCLTECPL